MPITPHTEPPGPIDPQFTLVDFVPTLWQMFAPQGYLKMFVVEHQGTVIVAELVFTMGSWFRTWRTGWSRLHADLRPNELLKWEMIKWAKANGFIYFDFVGFDMANAQAIAAGLTIPKTEKCGMSDFKLGFGGTVWPLPPHYCLFPEPIMRLWAKCRRPPRG